MFKLSIFSMVISLAARSVSGHFGLRFEGGTDLSAWLNELEFEQIDGSLDKYGSIDDNDRYTLYKQECTMRSEAVEWFWIMTDAVIIAVPDQNICDQAIVRCKSSEAGSLQSCDGKWAFKVARTEPGMKPFVIVGTVKTLTESPAESAGSGSGATSAAYSGVSAVSGSKLKFEGGTGLSAWINALLFEERIAALFYRDISNKYHLMKRECVMREGAVEWFWTITDAVFIPVPEQNICDQAIVRCKSSQYGLLESCDGKWAFKTTRTEQGINPFVVVGTVQTSLESTDGSAATEGTEGAATSSLWNQVISGWSAYSTPSTTTTTTTITTSSCHTLMKLAGNEMVDGIQWQMIPDPDREHGEAQYYYISDAVYDEYGQRKYYRLYKEHCAMTIRDQYFWVMVERDQELIDRDCGLAIGRCKAWEFTMCDGLTRQWAFRGNEGGHVTDSNVKIEDIWNECE